MLVISYTPHIQPKDLFLSFIRAVGAFYFRNIYIMLTEHSAQPRLSIRLPRTFLRYIVCTFASRSSQIKTTTSTCDSAFHIPIFEKKRSYKDTTRPRRQDPRHVVSLGEGLASSNTIEARSASLVRRRSYITTMKTSPMIIEQKCGYYLLVQLPTGALSAASLYKEARLN